MLEGEYVIPLGADIICIEKVVENEPAELLAVTVYVVLVISAVGVPQIVPFEDPKFMPDGREPINVYEVVKSPLLTLRGKLYACPLTNV